ncbi:MAG: Hsp20 family protein [Candidatus Obscuribacterales bacterium]|nr:Hsp20 family protein [Candidatus Obscuribacterales bacterium]
MLHIRELPLRREEWINTYSGKCGSMEFEWDKTTFSAPPTNVLEMDERYILEIALPGVVLDDVELKVEGQYLTLTAKRTPNMFEEKAQFLKKELPLHYLVREFEFIEEIIEEEIEARLDRGILFVSIPKFEAARRIHVSAGNLEQHMTETRVGKREKQVTVK